MKLQRLLLIKFAMQKLFMKQLSMTKSCITQLLGLWGLSAILSGCSSYGQKFPTQPDYGLGSASAYEIQDLVQQGRLEEQVKYTNNNKYRQHINKNVGEAKNKPNMPRAQDHYDQDRNDQNNDHLFNALVKDEEIIEITILPYTDNNGDVHLQQQIYSRLDNVK